MIAGRYEREAEIGRGGMGAVWRGRDTVLGRTVALKKIGMAPGGLSADALRAEREARLAAKLSHANVVAVFDLVREEPGAGDLDHGQQWLVMEYVDGTDLAETIRARGRLEPDEAAPVMAQTAAALAAAHGAGIVHRDVKPSNILVTATGQVKLSDFGIARAATDPSLTQTGLVTGSPAYLSPEVASGQVATPASDVWSWGASLFHAVEGRTPYGVEGDADGNLLGVLYRIVHEQPPYPEHAGWLAPAIEGTMERDLSQRWSMAQVQEFLEAGPAASAATGTRVVRRPRRAARPVPPPPPAASAGATQLLSATAATPTVPPAPPAAPPGPGGARRDTGSGRDRRRTLLLVLGAAVVLAVLTLGALLIGLRGDDDGGDTVADPGSSASAGSQSPSQDASQDAAPDADAMESFARDYVQTAASDPRAGFAQLTTAYQERSKGFRGYNSFWGNVSDPQIETISADPEALTVSYTYTYEVDGRRQSEDVVLQLEQTDDGFLISGAS
ncbi:protein kinase domain-containing protein [Nocardioides flavescens]|uniref:non-specific serine/threonine protein kinase n=1 Tax=Nocardioides flavescens TaxID=2691959 RepID=A0A6L7ETY3_9ACTN|nr:protein kinase [Nocardioides flavescens]